MSLEQKQQIEKAIRQFGSGSLTRNALHLFNALGYNTERQAPLEEPTYPAFREAFVAGNEKFSEEKALVQEWRQVDLLFQLSKEELTKQHALFDTGRVDNTIIESYLFFAMKLTRDSYSRTELSHITREVNRLFPMPVMLLFKHGSSLTLSVINRRLHKKDESKDVLEKVTVIKDIRIEQPHRAHIEILFDLSIQELYRRHHFQNFVELHRAWQQTLDTKELNKRFFQELANWYFWAQQHVQFPDDLEKEEEVRNATSLIRLITRVVFIWFIREKDLMPDQLFNEHFLRTFLNGFREKDTADSYYKAILQNLFFGTLNQKMGERAFAKEGSYNQNRTEYGVKNLFRYGTTFTVPEQQVLDLFGEVPFLNGGLFDCLDKPDESGKIQYVDGFSRNPQKQAHVPDFLFFGNEQEVDLNPVFGTKNKKYKVRGLICLLDSYKFTVTENTPVEEEIALDPELLGKVFENLLASYNPETKTTARKQTGSFYTPREVVNYMVDESLIAYLKPSLQQAQAADLEPGRPQPESLAEQGEEELETNLRHLLAYTEEPHRFSPAETETLIRAIHDCKILDPACGSGAYPMGILHKLVHVLHKLDPENSHWRELQRQKAIAETEEAFRIGNQQERLLRLHEIDEVFELNASDYGRKLYLIENCIYGVDIQPVAVQIAKLRFFISLIIDERKQPGKDNQGIRSLPNLETKFVAANTLFGLDRPAGQGVLQNQKVLVLEDKLKEIRHRYFGARTRREKLKYQQEDKQLRQEIAQLLVHDGMKPGTAKEIVSFDPYDQNASARFFDPEWMFGLTEGFDLVIGNPPYVRSEKLKDQKTAFKQQFPHCFTGTADLYVFFYERAIQVLRKGGVLCYITPNKYFRANYGKPLRDFLAKFYTLHQLIDFGDAPVFEAVAYPSIVVLQKQPAGKSHQVRALNWTPGIPIEDFPAKFVAESFDLPQVGLRPEGWQLEGGAVLRLLQKLRQTGQPLGEYVKGRFYYGIKTGLNEAFIVNRATRDRLIGEHASSTDLLKPYLRGRDVKRWSIQPADLYIIKITSSANEQHPWSGLPENEAEKNLAKAYPAIYRHLQQFRQRLIERDDQGQYYWELRSCIYWEEFEKEKILIPAISQGAAYAIDIDGHFSNDKTSICLPDEPKFVLALLNSKLLEWIIKQTAATKQGGFLEFKPMYVSKLPIVNTKNFEREQLSNLVSAILKAKLEEPASTVFPLETEVDRLVYKLYHLTWEEVLLVEPNFEQRHGMRQEAYEALEFREEVGAGDAIKEKVDS